MRKLAGLFTAGALGALLLGRRLPRVAANPAAGDVHFDNGAGGVATDSANFFWDDTNNRLGIGTNTPAARLHVSGTTPNILMGDSANTITSGVVGATISGGGESTNVNKVTDTFGTVGGGGGNQAGDNAGTTADRQYATVGGGANNRAIGSYATVGGGAFNTASGSYATVGGGTTNTASGSAATVGGGFDNTASDQSATVGGGQSNQASAAGAFVGGGGYDGTTTSGNQATAPASTIGGGLGNKVTDYAGVVGGGLNNTAGDNAGTTSDKPYATVGGGSGNQATNSYSTVGGGSNNTASSDRSTVGGGAGNTASGNASTVGGGRSNMASGIGAFVGGGGYDGIVVDPNEASGAASTIGGGQNNVASNSYATVGGGANNTASSSRATVGGGGSNTASNQYATVGGGAGNTATGVGAFVGGGGYDGVTSDGNDATGAASTIGGGVGNNASNSQATVGGGISNLANGAASTIGGGNHNTASQTFATVGGGTLNTSSGESATVPGGMLNTAAGDLSFAAGRRAKVDALHDGTFLWADMNDFDFNSTASNQFAARATGGLRFVTGIDGSGLPLTDRTFVMTPTGRLGIQTLTPAAPLGMVQDGFEAVQFSRPSGTQFSRLHATGDGINRFAVNLSYDGTNFNLDNTAHNGVSFLINSVAGASGIFAIQYASPGANPRPLTSYLFMKASGITGIGRIPTTNRLEVEGNASKTVAGDWLANSDRRIKTDIQDIEDALPTIQKLHPVRFKYTDEYRRKHPSVGDHEYYNFIAQEYAEVFPDSVQDDGEGLLQMDGHNVTPCLVRAVQELEHQNQALRQQLQEQNDLLVKRLGAIERLMGLGAET